MKSDPVLQRTALQLQQNWGVECGDEQAFERLKAALCLHLEWMIGHEFERLVHAMYRLDIPEGRFHQAMRLQGDRQKADALAELVMERERQRAETWVKYSAPKSEGND